MQDLTPQLRTRLGRVERAVGAFVLFATLMLASGFFYYLYHTADRKGWFVTKVRYCTSLAGTAAGIKIGDPVKYMGFDVGEITLIDTVDPDEIFNVYLEFVIRAPYHGYIDTLGSKVRVMPSDFLGNRVVEVTKGTNWTPTHLSWDVRELSLRDAAAWEPMASKLFLDPIVHPETLAPITQRMEMVTASALAQLQAAGVAKARIADRAKPTQQITVVWNNISNSFVPYTAHTKPYWLPPEESPALTDRLDDIARQVHEALPAFLALTNQLAATLTNTVQLTEEGAAVLLQSRTLVSNLNVIAGNLTQGEGSLGHWLLPPDLYNQTLATMVQANATLTNVGQTLTNAGSVLTAANTNLTYLMAELNPSLLALSSIISNLNSQVQENTNFVSTLHRLLIDTDSMVEGFKRHWLFRGAFKEKKPAPPKTPKGSSKAK